MDRKTIGNFGAAIVTFNRLEKLKKALTAIERQTVLPKYVIVVNNASTDGTGDFLRIWEKETAPFAKIIINKPVNDGGSGGFYTALEKGLSLDADWIYVSDDDAYPSDDAFLIFDQYINTHDTSEVASLCGAVIQYGKIALPHRRRITCRLLTISESSVPQAEYKLDSFPCDCFSYVGVFINKEKLRLAGLPNKDYFIQWDDTEHSIRMSRVGKIICIPAIRIDHELEYSEHAGYQWKDYYGIRNRMDGIKRDFPLRYTVVINIKRFFDIVRCWLMPDKEFARMITAAATDAWRGKLGIHSVYKPGWKPEKDRA